MKFPKVPPKYPFNHLEVQIWVVSLYLGKTLLLEELVCLSALTHQVYFFIAVSLAYTRVWD